MSNSAASGGDIFDVKKVRRLVELMKEHDLAEIDLRQGDQRVRLRRGGEPLVGTAVPTTYLSHSHSVANASQLVGEGAVAAGGETDLVVIKSPMVGTFYSAS